MIALDSKKGYVTFADILGWKGIWRDRKDDNPIKLLKDIKFTVDEAREKIILESLKTYHIKNQTLNQTFLNNLKITPYNSLKGMQDDYIKTLNGTSDEIRNQSDNFVTDNDVEIKIDLISDTFVITSSSKNNELEKEIHAKINQLIILECLKEKLLIRGATAYGEYYNEDLVFLGPAIDEAASWHELGEEIGIFFTMSAELNLDGNIKGLIETKSVKLKKGPLETLFINWSKGEDDFNKILLEQSPFLPEFAMKYINSKNYLKTIEK